jgi:hypothetical protein
MPVGHAALEILDLDRLGRVGRRMGRYDCRHDPRLDRRGDPWPKYKDFFQP